MEIDELPPDRGDKLERLRQVKEQMASLKEEYDDLVEEVLIPLKGVEFIIGEDGVKYRVSKSQSSNPTYHYDVLDEVPEDIREEIVKPKIDGDALKNAVKTGKLDPDIAVRLVTYTDKRPSPKFDPMLD